MSRSSYHHGDLRRALVAEALAAVERDGDLPSWRALARACGVSQSAPYRHFESADALRAAVAAEGFRKMATAIRAAMARETSSPSGARFEAGFRAYVDFGVRHSVLYSLMFSGDGPSALDQEGTAAARDAFSTLIEGISGYGVADPLSVAAVLWTAHHGLVEILRLGLSAPGMDRARLTEGTAAMLLAYLEKAASRGASRARTTRSRPRRA